jgi:hypothetical protein
VGTAREADVDMQTVDPLSQQQQAQLETTVDKSARPTDPVAAFVEAAKTLALNNSAVSPLPSYLASPVLDITEIQDRPLRRGAKNRAQAENNSVAGAFDSVFAAANSEIVNEGQSMMQKSSVVGSQEPNIATPSFMLDNSRGEKEKGRRRHGMKSRPRVDNNTAEAFESILTAASQNNTETSPSATLKSTGEPDITTPSFLQMSQVGTEEGSGRKRTKSRLRPGNNTEAAFESILAAVDQAEAKASSLSTTVRSVGESSQPPNVPTPSLLQISREDIGEEGRKRRIRNRVRPGNNTEAAFASILASASDEMLVTAPSAAQQEASQLSQERTIAVATPTLLGDDSLTEEHVEGRRQKARRGRGGAAKLADNEAAMALFDSVLMAPDSKGQQPKQQLTVAETERRRERLLDGPSTPSFLRDSPSLSGSRSESQRASRTEQSASYEDHTALARPGDPVIIVQTSVKKSSLADLDELAAEEGPNMSGEQAQPGAVEREQSARNSQEDSSGEMSGAVDALEQQRAAEGREEIAATQLEEELSVREKNKQQKFEETRALRASRKSEVLGYLVRLVVNTFLVGILSRVVDPD